ncbi:MAG TPA: hypothetical protein VK960_03565 [Acidimicrobiia bacterium]|nr:hypothetical protein [Acidimicrobiia bacterium]
MSSHRDDMGVAALIGLVLAVFGLVYVVGRASIPTFPSVAEGILATSSTEASLAGVRDAGLVEALHRERLSSGFPAVMDVMGAVDARLAFPHADAPTVWRPLQGERPDLADGIPIDVDVRYATSDITFRLLAGAAEPGVLQTDRMTVVLTMGGRSFVAGTGDCSLELSRSGYAPFIRPGVVEVVVPYFDGEIRCVDVAEIRSGDTISFTAAFGYEFGH